MNKNHYVVIMAGGIGSRFWPFSRTAKPKQFLDILGVGKSLLQLTFDRFSKIVPVENILIVTNADYEDLVASQLKNLPKDNILGEPLRRNTAPCIAYASHRIANKNPNAVITVAPSDHLILDEEGFLERINVAMDAAEDQDRLITIGLKPNRPETGFGYIQYIEKKGDLKEVKTFTEKPAKELAQKFLDSGDFVWNSGIFTWGVQAILNEFDNYLPEMAEVFDGIRDQIGTKNEKKAVASAYSQCSNISIDFGIMEKANNVYTVLGDFGWSDLGSWNALYELKEKDDSGNVVNANALLYETSNSMIQVDRSKLVVIQGLKDYLVTENEDVLLICELDQEAKFREFVKDVKEIKGKKYL